MDFLGNLGTQLGALALAVIGIFGYLWNRDRKVKKATRAEDAAAGEAAKTKVETEHAADTAAERLERLRKASRKGKI